MENFKFLEEAIILQMVRLLRLLDERNLPASTISHIDDELNKLLAFTEHYNLVIPYDLQADIFERNLL